MSYNPTPSKTDTERMPKQGNQPQRQPQDDQRSERAPSQQPSQQGNRSQEDNVKCFPQQKTKAADGPANNPDDSPQPKQNEPTKASNVA